MAARVPSGRMRCPHCSHDDTRVVDSRPADGQSAIRRRRECVSCGERFTTYERVEPVLMVRKRSGSLQPFAAQKIRSGVEAALADRPVPTRAVDELVSRVEEAVAANPFPTPTDEVGRLVLAGLKELDQVAYVRFASVYKDFSEVEDFGKELAQLEVNRPD